MTPRVIFFRFFCIILVFTSGSCNTVRKKLSDSEVGDTILTSYDWTSDKVGQGVSFTVDKVSDFIDEVDEQWLTNLLDKIHVPGSVKEVDEAEDGVFEAYNGKFIWPVKYSKKVMLTSQFGFRWGRRHRGIDLGGPTGTPVYAVAPGKVIYAGNSMRGFGNLIIIQHKDNFSSYYAHNSVLKVKQGVYVKQGTKISLIGATGRATGPHLHFEIRKARKAINPCLYLPKHKMFTCKL